MSFNPNTLLNNPANLLTVRSQGGLTPGPVPGQAKAEPVPLPPYDLTMYENAYGRLGLMNIANVADLGCGCGNFTGVMVLRRQRPEVYLGVDKSHGAIQTAKAAYPGWNFIYGDFTSPQVIQHYERFEAYLLLNVLDVIDDDLGLVGIIPSGKPILFSMPRFPKEGSVRYYDDVNDLRDRYSNFLSFKTVGRFNISTDIYFMVVAVRW
ncbi:MAG: class I SAM-dependent methyltransferase [Deltaproteobacteria bacterium]|jgi:trans-aconitate methyltransferase|nr:class I SAM-dependent methyltransferase [Deltaproteobacteria bacterium]